MRKLKLLFLAFVFTGSALFAGDYYLGVSTQTLRQFTSGSVVFPGNLEKVGYGVGLQGGYVFFKKGNFSTAVEGRYSYTWNPVSDTEILSVFLKPAYSTSFYNVTVYGLLGVSTVHNRAVKGWNNGFAYGLGIQKPVLKNVDIFLDYTINAKQDGARPNALTLGFNYKF